VTWKPILPMNFYWVYNLPNWLFATLTVAVFVSFSMLGLWICRHLTLRIFGRHSQNDIVSFYLSTAGVFYGITLGLIAVGTYTTFSDVDNAVAKEAASVAALYRDVSSYPEPARAQLRREIEDYVRFVIDDEWPKQRQGILSLQGVERITRMQGMLGAFNPSTEREKIVHGEAFNLFNRLAEQRRMRLQSVKGGLPLTMYGVIIIGAILNIVISWLLVVDSFKLHAVLNVLMAALLGLLVYLIAAMDNPFRGEYSVSSEAFELVRNQLMEPENHPDAPGRARH
jgi:uncharacterized membrane protein YraQ (UPF0718 family)